MGRAFLDINWASTVINTLLVAFFVIVIGAMLIGIYAARTLGKREKAAAKAHGTIDMTPSKKDKKSRKAAKASEAAVNTPGSDAQ